MRTKKLRNVVGDIYNKNILFDLERVASMFLRKVFLGFLISCLSFCGLAQSTRVFGEGKKIYKVVLLGDADVGKTALCEALGNRAFRDDLEPTIFAGISLMKFCDIKGEEVFIQVWDTAGQERYRALTKTYLTGSNVALVVFDKTNRKSFENVDLWIEYVRDSAGSNCKIILIGNKTDLEEVVIRKDLKDKAIYFTVDDYLETSARYSGGINDLKYIVARVLLKGERLKLDRFEAVEIELPLNRKVGCC
ncbi:MAG: GTP-binding protein [Oscillospiraceae bacterium]|jgi:small GTP-binding protein|nr:GTP-binding protein [Oscillospiraceae bacterium]